MGDTIIKNRPDNDCLSSIANCFDGLHVTLTIDDTGEDLEIQGDIGILPGHGFQLRTNDVAVEVYMANEAITSLPANSMAVPANTEIDVKQQFTNIWIKGAEATQVWIRGVVDIE